MDARRVTSRLLLAALLLGIAAAWYAAPLFGSEPVTRENAAATAADGKSEPQDGIIVYYFHGTRRCKTCRAIEAYAKEAVEGKYGEQLESGQLKWNVVNTDEPDNKHFVEDFGLVSSSLVVVEMNGDEVTRYQILQDAWTLVRDKPRFIEYVQRSIGEYLKS
jgi:hypothetical protein